MASINSVTYCGVKCAKTRLVTTEKVVFWLDNDIADHIQSHKYVNYDHPGECSAEKDCLW